jgi:hypothetical protein
LVGRSKGIDENYEIYLAAVQSDSVIGGPESFNFPRAFRANLEES